MKVLENISKNKSLGLKKSKLKNAGFTMIELLVVFGIFAVIMGVALFNQAGLNSNILLTNLAYETALAVREAQTYGIGVRATASTTPNFNMGYGAYFDTSNTGQNQIAVFGDSDGDYTYDAPTELQSLYQVQNQRGNKIVSACVGQPGACTSVTQLSIMFKRPNPEASFYKIEGGGAIKITTGPAVIVVNNAQGTNCRAIVVEVTGQIRVENSTGGNCINTP
jgi:prepilin-type N-terminal cleavage/methylation domain-containing protein